MSETPQGQDSQAAAATAKGPEFGLQRIYVKDLSFEAPHAPQVFTESWQPHVNVGLNTQVNALGNDHLEVVLVVTVTVKSGDKTAYHVEVQQAGIFVARDVPEKDRGPLVGIVCPNILFPYAREVISDLVSRGSYPQMLLAPVNFEALYMQRVAQLREQAAQGAAQAAPTAH
jgi:preprotein translocase subunit SecB